MFSLLRSEWFCVRKSTAVKITFLIVTAVSVFMGIYMLKGDMHDVYFNSENQYLLYGGGNLMGQMGDTSTCLLVVSLLSGWLIGESFENRTIQGAVSFGKSRTKVYLAKVVLFLLISSLFCLALWFGSCIPVFVTNGIGTAESVGNLSRISYLAGMVVSGILAYMSLFSVCAVIGFFVRKTGMAIGFCMIAIVFGVRMIELLVPQALQEYLSYTPLGLYGEVLTVHVEWADMIRTGCLGLVWTAVICGIGLWNFKKTELK